MAQRKKNIACLESMWDNQTENRLNVSPVLDIISKVWNAKVSHLSCNTKEELSYNLKLICKRNYGILYLAFHGAPGALLLHGAKVTLPELAAMMSCRFTNWIVHFSCCKTFRKQKDLSDFIAQTGAAMVTGYTIDVNWVESTAFELLFFDDLQYYERPKMACQKVLKKYGDLAKITGFCAYARTPKGKILEITRQPLPARQPRSAAELEPGGGAMNGQMRRD